MCGSQPALGSFAGGLMACVSLLAVNRDCFQFLVATFISTVWSSQNMAPYLFKARGRDPTKEAYATSNPQSD
jgi:hypothetical protein